MKGPNEEMTTLDRRRLLALGAAAAASALYPLPGRALPSQGFERLHGRETPPLALPDLDGTTQDLGAYRGHVVMLNFWADWCPPCIKEIPSLHRAWIMMRAAGVELLTVHVGGTARSVRQFMQDRGLKFPVLLDADAQAFKAWPTMGLPSTFVLDADGNLVLGAAGAREWDSREMMDPILALLKGKSSRPGQSPNSRRAFL
jgi:peroxiredoxin